MGVILPAAGIVAESTTDREFIARALADHEADVAYIPIADLHRVGGRGDAHHDCKPPIIVVRADLDESTRRNLLDALLGWLADRGGISGAFKPYYHADVQSFFHELAQLPDCRKAAGA